MTIKLTKADVRNAIKFLTNYSDTKDYNADGLREYNNKCQAKIIANKLSKQL